MPINTLALGIILAAQSPPDEILLVEITAAPFTAHVLFLDEGVLIDARGQGQLGMQMLSDARWLVQDQPPPSTESPLMQCMRAAQIACIGGVKSVTVTDESCSFTCFPPTPSPKPPSVPLGGSGGTS